MSALLGAFVSTVDIHGIAELLRSAPRDALAAGFFTEQYLAGVARDTFEEREHAVEVIEGFG